jgi:hypothetical protein
MGVENVLVRLVRLFCEKILLNLRTPEILLDVDDGKMKHEPRTCTL